MTIKSNDLLGVYADITPIKTKFTDENSANVLKVVSISDDFSSTCVVQYFLYYLQNNEAQLMFTDTIPISGQDYINWSNEDLNIFPYTFVANKLTLTIL